MEHDIKPIEWIDEKVKVITRQILDDGKEKKWDHVHQGLKEICYLCSKRGLTYNQFIALRKDIIEGIEKFEPFAKSYIEMAERGTQ